MTLSFNLYRAGERSAETLLCRSPDFATALRMYANDAAAWAIVPVGEADELAALGSLDSIAPRYGEGMYVLRCGDGYSCLGFAYAAKRTADVAAWLRAAGKPLERDSAEPGTPDAFALYNAAMAAGAAHNRATGERCPVELVPQLIGLEGKRVEVRHGDEVRRFIVGKSTGWMPCHLEIKTRASTGGGPVWGAPFDSVRVI